jgi:hypothetical protein
MSNPSPHVPNPFADQASSATPSPNPYESPQFAAMPQLSPTSTVRLVKKLRDFRTQIVALGAAWIVLAAIGLAAGAFLFASRGGGEIDEEGLWVVAAIVLSMGLIWLVLGIWTCAKQMWSVYTGLVLCYVSAAGNLFSFNLCAIAILVVLIVQAHRVIGLASELKRAGILLNTRPGDLQVNFVPPA